MMAGATPIPADLASPSPESISRSPPRARHRVAGVFEGGGAKGLAYIGALEAMLELDCWFGSVAGASAGAITAALVAAGLTPQEIREQTPVALGKLQTRPLRDLRRLSREGGFLSKDGLLTWLDELLTSQVERLSAPSGTSRVRLGPVTFWELYRVTGIELNVVAVDISLQRQILFSARDTPFCQVADAVVASASIPFVFKPSIFTTAGSEAQCGRDKTQTGALDSFSHCVVDGGVWANFPLHVFTDATFRAASGRPVDHNEEFVVGFILDEEREDDAPSLANLRFERDGTGIPWMRSPWERRHDHRDRRGWKEKLLAAVFFPVQLFISGGMMGTFDLRPGRWPRPARGLLRHVLDAIDGTAVVLGRPIIGFGAWALIAISAVLGIETVLLYLQKTGGSIAAQFGRGLLYLVAIGVVSATVLGLVASLMAFVANMLLLRSVRDVLYGLALTYVDAPGAPPWAVYRDDVVALPIPRDVSMLSFDLLNAKPATFEVLVQSAHDVTFSRVSAMLTQRVRQDIRRALTLSREGHISGARAALERARNSEHKTLSSVAALLLGVGLAAHNDAPGGRAQLELAIRSEDPLVVAAARIALADMLRTEREDARAEETLRAVIASEATGAQPEAWLKLGILLEGSRAHDAREAYEKALAASDPETALHAAVRLALLLVDAGDHAAVARILDRAIAIDDDRLPGRLLDFLVDGELPAPLNRPSLPTPRAACDAFLAATARGDSQEAERSLADLMSRSFLQDRGTTAALIWLAAGDNERRRGRVDEADKIYQAASAISAVDIRGDVAVRRAAIYETRGDTEKADGEYEVALSSREPRTMLAAALRKARRLSGQARIDQAKEVLSLAITNLARYDSQFLVPPATLRAGALI